MKKILLIVVLTTLYPFFKATAQNNAQLPTHYVSGKVIDEQGQPLPGATVKLKGTTTIKITDRDGNFKIMADNISGILLISFISYQTKAITITANNNQGLTIVLNAEANPLNEIQVIGYGTTTKRFNTGSVSTITSKDIQEQPVTNVLSALSGRMPGVFVQTTNGLPGGNTTIQIRGQGSITAGNNPLYIIDGVPFNSSVGSLSSTNKLSVNAVNGALSPFNSINPDDIDNISVLKDADATSIYGSRGSNGVVLITTKKGKSGKTQATVSVDQGYTQATNIPKMLNLSQYIQIRNESFANDGLTPSSNPNSNTYAPDLTLWQNSNPTDWAKYLLGGTGHLTNAQANISGGSNGTNFTVGGTFHSEKTYLPGDNSYNRGGLNANIQHTSENKRFYLQFSNSLTIDDNRMVNPYANIAYDILLPPNYPVYDSGAFNWHAGSNPVAEINATAKTRTQNLISNLLLQYTILKDLRIKISAGYNNISVDQTQIFPSSSLYPGTLNYTNFGKNSNQYYILEPQLDYKYQFKSSVLSFLVGGTYQNSVAQGETITATNFSSESLMQNLASASTYQTGNVYTQYKYASIFGRITYNLNDKYIINASIRQDASSRFGTADRIGNFGSLGAAWIWSEESFFKDLVPFISFGKLRASYGLTGNDQITDYQYLSTYGSSGYVYQGISGLKPTRIANDDFHWEKTKKLEFAIELGFIKNRVLFNINHYQDLTSDQLVSYTIPSLTGFTSYQANLPATVENTGWEFELNTKNIQGSKISWSTTFNITLPHNELKSFPNLSSSSYANTLVIGEDISRIYGFQFAGFDNNGLTLYNTKTGVPSNNPSSATDSYYTIGKKTPDFYGGIGNTISYKGWSLDVFGQFSKQMAVGNLIYSPGAQGFNNYDITLNRWTSPASQTNIPKASTFNDYNYYQSSANYFDASYFRVKNIALSYSLPKIFTQKMNINQARIFIQAQNMLTFWHSNNPLLDPESGTFSYSSNNLPPAKSIVIGIQTTF